METAKLFSRGNLTESRVVTTSQTWDQAVGVCFLPLGDQSVVERHMFFFCLFVCFRFFFFFQYLQTWNKILALLRTQTCQPLEGSSHHQSFWVSSLPTHPADLETCQCPKLYKPISYNRSLSISLCLCVFLSIYLPPIPLVIFLWRVLIEQEAPKSWQPEQIHMYIHVYMAWKSIKWNLGKLPITFQLMLRLHKM